MVIDMEPDDKIYWFGSKMSFSRLVLVISTDCLSSDRLNSTSPDISDGGSPCRDSLKVGVQQESLMHTKRH